MKIKPEKTFTIYFHRNLLDDENILRFDISEEVAEIMKDTLLDVVNKHKDLLFPTTTIEYENIWNKRIATSKTVVIPAAVLQAAVIVIEVCEPVEPTGK